jgi:hypothetical protein
MAKDLTGSHDPDVSDAIERLYKDGLILISEFRANKRDKRFFKLSRKGLESLIDTREESPSPEEFWKALLWYCRLRKKEIDWNSFDSLYRRFQNIYLGYTPHREHFFQFRFIDILFKKWLKDNDKIYDPVRDNIPKGVVISQRILECLGMNRLVTLGQLCQYIEEQRPVFEGDEKIGYFPFSAFFGLSIDGSEEGIKSALEKFTLPGDYHGPYYPHRPELRYDFDWLLSQYADFIQHLVVVPRLEKGDTRYELSLFGIVLLVSVRTYYQFLDPEMLFYNIANALVYIEKALADEINFLFYISFYVRDPDDRRRRVEPLYLRYFPDMFKPIYWTRTVHMKKDFDLVQRYMENGVPVYKHKETVHMEINTEVGKYPTTSIVNIIRKHKEVQQLLVTWIDDASKCQNDVQSKMSSLKNYTRKGD